MIAANITTWEGMCTDAEHFYCNYCDIGDNIPNKYCSVGSFDSIELKRTLSKSESDYLNKKDLTISCYSKGSKTNRFDSIEQIHDRLKKLFPNQNIITYLESQLFKEMLYLVDGKNIGIESFGEIYNNVPTSCYKDLVPEDVKIKCERCGKEHLLEDVTYERDYNFRPLLYFTKKRDMDELCCNRFELIWNTVL